jgi:hypothetical protein
VVLHKTQFESKVFLQTHLRLEMKMCMGVAFDERGMGFVKIGF